MGKKTVHTKDEENPSWISIQDRYIHKVNEMKHNFTVSCPYSPVKEFLYIRPGFYYTDEVIVSIRENRMYYHSYLTCKYKYVKKPSIRFGMVYVIPTTEEPPATIPTYSNVAIIGTRHFASNIYHFMESANMLLHFLMQPNHPLIDFIYFDDNVTDIQTSAWKEGYFRSILHLFPKDHQPILLQCNRSANASYLAQTKPVVLFRNVLFLPLITRVESTFMSSREVDLLRGDIYKRWNRALSRDQESPIEILYYNRSFRRTIVNGDELVNCLKQSYQQVHSLVFDGQTFEQQVQTMMGTDLFISIHGAQLSNILFLKPMSGVIEVFNPMFFLSCYQDIAVKARLRYVPVVNTTIVGPIIKKRAWNLYVNLDVRVNITQMLTIVNELVKRMWCV